MTDVRPITRLLAPAVLACAAVLWTAPISVEACPSCKEAVAHTDEGGAQTGASAHRQSLGAGFSLSVLFMLAVPFALAAGFGGAVYWCVKQQAAMGQHNSRPNSL